MSGRLVDSPHVVGGEGQLNLSLALAALTWAAKHALPPTDDDTPILVGSGGRRASPEELLEFIADEQERIARGG